MNNKKLINDRKDMLRKHLETLMHTKYISRNDLIRDGAYYAKNVIPYLVKMGHVTPEGFLIREFLIEPVIQTLWTTKPKKAPKEIAPKAAKSIGQKMSKSRIDLKEIIKQNETQPKVEFKMLRIIDGYTDQELKDELTARGWHGELMKTMQ
jgi:hypothetical protein